MKICCIGAGYVGGPTMAIIALKCPEHIVKVVDINEKRIQEWNSANLPIFEPGLKEIVEERRNKNLFFSTNVIDAIKESEIIFVSVNTPTKEYGSGKGFASDLKYIEECIRLIAKVSTGYKIIVEKSTVPVKTAEVIEIILKANNPKLKFSILSNPEFLAEGSAIKDLLYPERILIGGNNKNLLDKSALNKLISIYQSWVPRKNILVTNTCSSELSKLVSNAFLAQKISSINSISALCDNINANILEVSKAVGMDSRIGEKFLQSSVGFGGSCFQKDVLNLVYICKSLKLDEIAEYWLSVIKINNYQRRRFVLKLLSLLNNTISNKKVLILGYAFKKNTNDIRESSAITICKQLLEEHAKLSIYDPKVKFSTILKSLNIETFDIKEKISYSKNIYKLAYNANAILLLTEWDEFKFIDYVSIYKKIKKPAYILDGRNLLKNRKLLNIGYLYSLGQ